MSQFQTPSSQTSTGQENQSDSARNRRTSEAAAMGSIPIIPNARKKLSFNTPLPSKPASDTTTLPDDVFWTPQRDSISRRSPSTARRASNSLKFHKSLRKKTPRTHIKSKFSPNTVTAKTEGRLRGFFRATDEFGTVNPIYWKNMQEVTLTKWVNSFLATDRTSKSTPIGVWGNSPFLNRRLRKFNKISWSEPVQERMARLNEQIVSHSVRVDEGVSICGDNNAREYIVDLFSRNYNPQWLICALCVFFGRHLGFHVDDNLHQEKLYEDEEDSEQLVLNTIRNLLSNHLFDVTLENEGREDHDFNATILSRTLSLVLILDAGKSRQFEVFGTDPPLFRPGCSFKSSEDVVIEFTRRFCRKSSGVLRQLAYNGYRVDFVAPRVEQIYDLYTENVIQDLRDGARLSKIASVAIKKMQPLANIQIIQKGKGTQQQLRLACARNVSLVFTALSAHSHAFAALKAQPDSIVSGDQAQSLELLWALSDAFVELHLVDEAMLEAEVEHLMATLREKKNVRVRKVNQYWQEMPFSPRKDLQIFVDDAASKKRYLLLKWACLACHHHDVKVEEYTESFRDGAAICTLVHHYCPDLIARDEIISVTRFGVVDAKKKDVETRLVQRNFANFLRATRTLGGVPILGLSPTVSTSRSLNIDKDVAYGNLNYLIVGYLFRRLVVVRLLEANLRSIHEVLSPMDTPIHTATPVKDRADPIWDPADRFNPMNRLDEVQATFNPPEISPLAPLPGPNAFGSRSPRNYPVALNGPQTLQSAAACEVQRALRMRTEHTLTRKIAEMQRGARTTIQRAWRSYIHTRRTQSTLLRKKTLADFFQSTNDTTSCILTDSWKMLATLEHRTKIAKLRFTQMKTIESTQACLDIQRTIRMLLQMRKYQAVKPYAHPAGGITLFPRNGNGARAGDPNNSSNVAALFGRSALDIAPVGGAGGGSDYRNMPGGGWRGGGTVVRNMPGAGLLGAGASGTANMFGGNENPRVHNVGDVVNHNRVDRYNVSEEYNVDRTDVRSTSRRRSTSHRFDFDESHSRTHSRRNSLSHGYDADEADVRHHSGGRGNRSHRYDAGISGGNGTNNYGNRSAPASNVFGSVAALGTLLKGAGAGLATIHNAFEDAQEHGGLVSSVLDLADRARNTVLKKRFSDTIRSQTAHALALAAAANALKRKSDSNIQRQQRDIADLRDVRRRLTESTRHYESETASNESHFNSDQFSAEDVDSEIEESIQRLSNTTYNFNTTNNQAGDDIRNYNNHFDRVEWQRRDERSHEMDDAACTTIQRAIREKLVPDRRRNDDSGEAPTRAIESEKDTARDQARDVDDSQFLTDFENQADNGMSNFMDKLPQIGSDKPGETETPVPSFTSPIKSNDQNNEHKSPMPEPVERTGEDSRFTFPAPSAIPSVVAQDASPFVSRDDGIALKSGDDRSYPQSINDSEEKNAQAPYNPLSGLPAVPSIFPGGIKVPLKSRADRAGSKPAPEPLTEIPAKHSATDYPVSSKMAEERPMLESRDNGSGKAVPTSQDSEGDWKNTHTLHIPVQPLSVMPSIVPEGGFSLKSHEDEGRLKDNLNIDGVSEYSPEKDEVAKSRMQKRASITLGETAHPSSLLTSASPVVPQKPSPRRQTEENTKFDNFEGRAEYSSEDESEVGDDTAVLPREEVILPTAQAKVILTSAGGNDTAALPREEEIVPAVPADVNLESGYANEDSDELFKGNADMFGGSEGTRSFASSTTDKLESCKSTVEMKNISGVKPQTTKDNIAVPAVEVQKEPVQELEDAENVNEDDIYGQDSTMGVENQVAANISGTSDMPILMDEVTQVESEEKEYETSPQPDTITSESALVDNQIETDFRQPTTQLVVEESGELSRPASPAQSTASSVAADGGKSAFESRADGSESDNADGRSSTVSSTDAFTTTDIIETSPSSRRDLGNLNNPVEKFDTQRRDEGWDEMDGVARITIQRAIREKLVPDRRRNDGSDEAPPSAMESNKDTGRDQGRDFVNEDDSLSLTDFENQADNETPNLMDKLPQIGSNSPVESETPLAPFTSPMKSNDQNSELKSRTLQPAERTGEESRFTFSTPSAVPSVVGEEESCFVPRDDSIALKSGDDSSDLVVINGSERKNSPAVPSILPGGHDVPLKSHPEEAGSKPASASRPFTTPMKSAARDSKAKSRLLERAAKLIGSSTKKASPSPSTPLPSELPDVASEPPLERTAEQLGSYCEEGSPRPSTPLLPASPVVALKSSQRRTEGSTGGEIDADIVDVDGISEYSSEEDDVTQSRMQKRASITLGDTSHPSSPLMSAAPVMPPKWSPRRQTEGTTKFDNVEGCSDYSSEEEFESEVGDDTTKLTHQGLLPAAKAKVILTSAGDNEAAVLAHEEVLPAVPAAVNLANEKSNELFDQHADMFGDSEGSIPLSHGNSLASSTAANFEARRSTENSTVKLQMTKENNIGGSVVELEGAEDVNNCEDVIQKPVSTVAVENQADVNSVTSDLMDTVTQVEGEEEEYEKSPQPATTTIESAVRDDDIISHVRQPATQVHEEELQPVATTVESAFVDSQIETDLLQPATQVLEEVSVKQSRVASPTPSAASSMVAEEESCEENAVRHEDAGAFTATDDIDTSASQDEVSSSHSEDDAASKRFRLWSLRIGKDITDNTADNEVEDAAARRVFVNTTATEAGDEVANNLADINDEAEDMPFATPAKRTINTNVLRRNHEVKPADEIIPLSGKKKTIFSTPSPSVFKKRTTTTKDKINDLIQQNEKVQAYSVDALDHLKTMAELRSPLLAAGWDETPRKTDMYVYDDGWKKSAQSEKRATSVDATPTKSETYEGGWDQSERSEKHVSYVDENVNEERTNFESDFDNGFNDDSSRFEQNTMNMDSYYKEVTTKTTTTTTKRSRSDGMVHDAMCIALLIVKSSCERRVATEYKYMLSALKFLESVTETVSAVEMLASIGIAYEVVVTAVSMYFDKHEVTELCLDILAKIRTSIYVHSSMRNRNKRATVLLGKVARTVVAREAGIVDTEKRIASANANVQELLRRGINVPEKLRVPHTYKYSTKVRQLWKRISAMHNEIRKVEKRSL